MKDLWKRQNLPTALYSVLRSILRIPVAGCLLLWIELFIPVALLFDLCITLERTWRG